MIILCTSDPVLSGILSYKLWLLSSLIVTEYFRYNFYTVIIIAMKRLLQRKKSGNYGKILHLTH